jgi:hypothetical protein
MKSCTVHSAPCGLTFVRTSDFWSSVADVQIRARAAGGTTTPLVKDRHELSEVYMEAQRRPTRKGRIHSGSCPTRGQSLVTPRPFRYSRASSTSFLATAKVAGSSLRNTRRDRSSYAALTFRGLPAAAVHGVCDGQRASEKRSAACTSDT